MSQLLFDHPHRDKMYNVVLIPTELKETHAGKYVLYKTRVGDKEGMMPLETWEKFCEPIIFKTPEGP